MNGSTVAFWEFDTVHFTRKWHDINSLPNLIDKVTSKIAANFSHQGSIASVNCFWRQIGQNSLPIIYWDATTNFKNKKAQDFQKHYS